MKGNRKILSGCKNEGNADPNANRQQSQVHQISALIGNGALRQHFLELSRRNQAACERGARPRSLREKATPILNWGNVRRANVKFRRANQRDAQRAEGVAECGPLRHRGHRNAAQGDRDNFAEDQADGDPSVINDALVHATCRQWPAACQPRRPRRRGVL